MGETRNDPRPSGLGIVLLGMLMEGPMHAYRMQKLIRERGKDKVVNVRQRTSIHQALDRLERGGCLRPAGQAVPDGDRYPERRVYEITPRGRELALRWVSDMIAVPREEFADFPAALSVLSMLDSEVARGLLVERCAAVATAIAALRGDRARYESVPRVYFVEDEYRLVLLQAEHGWLERLVDDIDRGEITWIAPAGG
jgi:DNA-binding PadR family transcriptional regulator